MADLPQYRPPQPILNTNTRTPQPPSAIDFSLYRFPTDIQANGRNFYSQIMFVDYNSASGSPKLTSGGVIIPLPQKINDVQVVEWNQVSGMGALAQTAAAGAAIYEMAHGKIGGAASATAALTSAAQSVISSTEGVASAYFGYALNPMMLMAFKQPNFKEYIFQWQFIANNAQESLAIFKIINYFKYNMLPTRTGAFGSSMSGVYKYPNIAVINLYPFDYLLQFKPCAVKVVSHDPTGANGPAFFKSNAPVVVNLTVAFQEIELWSQDTYPYKP